MVVLKFCSFIELRFERVGGAGVRTGTSVQELVPNKRVPCKRSASRRVYHVLANFNPALICAIKWHKFGGVLHCYSFSVLLILKQNGYHRAGCTRHKRYKCYSGRMRWVLIGLAAFCFLHIYRDIMQIKYGYKTRLTKFGHFWHAPKYEVHGIVVFTLIGLICAYLAISWF